MALTSALKEEEKTQADALLLNSERKDAENRASSLTAELTKTKTLLRNAQKDSVTLKKTLEVQTAKIFNSEEAVHKAEEHAKEHAQTIEQQFAEKLKEALDAEHKAEAWNKVLEDELKAAKGKVGATAKGVAQAGLRGDVAQNKLKETDLLLAEALSTQSETRMELQDAQSQHEEDESKILELQQKQLDTEEKLVAANKKASAQHIEAMAHAATKAKETLEAVRLHALRRVAEDRKKQEETEAKLAKAKLDAIKSAEKLKAAELKHAEAEEKLEVQRQEAQVSAKIDKVLADAMKGGPAPKKRNKAGKVGEFVKTLKAKMH